MKNLKIFLWLIFAVTPWFNATSQNDPEAFWNAARRNDTAALKTLMAKGVKIDVANHYGQTALLFAIDKGNLDAVNFLLENGADQNRKDSFYNENFFNWALYRKNPAIITSLINHGADLKNENALMSAAESGLKDIVKLMLEKGASGADVLLLAAIRYGDTAMFDISLGYSVKNDSLLSVVLVTAKGKNNEYFTGKLLNAGAKLPEKKQQPGNSKIAETASGTYVSPDMSKAVLKYSDGTLTASFDGSPDYPLIPSNDSVYKFADFPGISITLKKIGEQIPGFVFVQPQRTINFTRFTSEVKKESPAANIAEDYSGVEKPENWPAFRGNENKGTADGQHPPVTWDAKTGKNLIWKTFIPGLAHASPVVWKTKVFLITAQSSDTAAEYRVGLFGDVEPAADTSSHIWKIYCLDKNSGKILWEKKAFGGKPRVKRHVKGTQANASPATNGEYVVAVFGSEGMVCYDLNGKEIWKKDLGIIDAGWFFNEETQWGPASSPVIYRNTVILQCDRSKDCYIAAWDLKTGNEVWKTPREEISSWGTPAVCHGPAYDEIVTNASRFIRGYDPANGKELWKLSPNSEITVGSPVPADSLVFVTAGYSPLQPVYAIRPGGKGNISIPDSLNSGPYIKWRKKRGGTYMPTPIAYNGFFYTLSNNGTLICYDIQTGEVKFKQTLKGDAFTASPVAADGKLYCTSEEKGVFVIRAGAEFELITVNPVGEICMATPAISDGLIFIRGQRHLFCFGLGK